MRTLNTITISINSIHTLPLYQPQTLVAQIMLPRILAAITAVLVAGAIPHFHKSLNAYMMGFFRDLSRVKARKRRMQKDAVISMHDIKAIVFDEEEDPLQDVANKIMSEDGLLNDDVFTKDLPIYTREELHELGNGDDGVLLLSIFGRVYDVSTGEKYYGEDGRYNLFAGRDVTRSLSTGCLQQKCLGPKTGQGEGGEAETDAFEMNDKTIKEGKKWVAFFETHDAYKHVGFLKDGQFIEHLIDSLVEQETASLNKRGENDEPVPE